MPPKPKPPKQKQPPTPEEIEALRAARAAKRELEVAQREAVLQVARAVDRERVGKGEVPVDGEGRRLFVGREWAGVRGVREGGKGRRVRVVSWNILAQGLIQRKLFPNSDALKWRDRSPGLTAELVGHAFDVGCLQEVDRFEVHSETLKHHGYAYEYQRGYRAKKHGLAIVWRTIPRPDTPSVIFDPLPAGRALLYLDHASVSGIPQQGRTACSRETRNIALFVAIRFASEAGKGGGGGGGGLIVATTHTFWHPKHSYERARQVGVLIRELDRFRRRPGAEWNGWDCVLAGDFNDQPDSMTYELATARPTLRSVAIEEVASSMVVHSSVDEKLNAPPVPGDGREERKAGLVEITSEVGAIDGMGTIKAEGAQGKKKSDVVSNSNSTPIQADRDAEEEEEGDGAEEGEGEDEEVEAEAEAGEEHDDRMLKNCRLSRTSDGLLTLNELRQLYDLSGPPPSSEVEGNAYDAAQYPDPRSQLDNSVKAGGVVGLQSAYGSFYNRLVSSSTEKEDDKDGLEAGNFFGSPTRGRERWNDPDWTKSEHVGDGYEPMWTLFSALFSLTLDYVFLFPRNAPSPDEKKKKEKERSFYPEVTALLRTHRTEVLQPGTPRKYVNASDHVKIGAEIVVD